MKIIDKVSETEAKAAFDNCKGPYYCDDHCVWRDHLVGSDWYLSEIESKDIANIYIILWGKTGALLDYDIDSSDDPCWNRIRVDQIKKDIDNFGISKELFLMAPTMNSNNFAIADGNHRCMAYQELNKTLVGAAVYLAVNKKFDNYYLWNRC